MTTEKELENALLGFHRRLVAELQKEAERLHFTPSQLEVLHFVSGNGNPTMKEIAAALDIAPPSATAIVDALCEDGFLKRELDDHDRRIVRVVFTPKTFKTFSALKDAKLLILKNLFAKLDDRDKAALSDILKKIIDQHHEA